MLPEVDAIIFDLGGVILNLDYQLTIDAFQKLGLKDAKELYSQADQTDLFDAIETGQISGQHFINKLLPLLDEGTSPNKVVDAWNAMILDYPIERLELLSSLNKKYRIFLLSNTNEIHLPFALRRLKEVTSNSLDSYFEKAYFSHEMGLRKPNKEIFQSVCDAHGLNPKKTLFIDDSIQHVEGAKSIGLNAIHLTNGMTIQDLFS